MPTKKNRGGQNASEKDRRGKADRERTPPGRSYDAGEDLDTQNEEYDDQRSSLSPEYEQDFDVNENDTDRRKSERRDLKKDLDINDTDSESSSEEL